MNTSLQLQVDHLVLHANALFCFGWALDRQGVIMSADMLLRLSDGTSRRVGVSVHRVREDVGLAFPDHPSASSSGFMAIAGWSGASLVAATMEFRGDGGRCMNVELELPPPGAVARRKSLRYLARRAYSDIRLGRVGALWNKLRAQRLRSLFRAPPARSDELERRLAGKRCRLVIDHQMGGGANLYREGRVAEWLAAGDTVAVLSFQLDIMALRVRVRDADGDTEHAIEHPGELAAPLGGARLEEILLNCAVSFPQPGRLQAFMLDQLQASDARLTVAMHEYFVVCPSPFLLDAKGKHCGLPATGDCERCLGEHTDGFVSLAGTRSIEEWRRTWGAVLAASDRILCFSESSRRLLARAYPQFQDRVVLQPHAVPVTRRVTLHRRTGRTLTVGVVGAISEHKGALVVEDLMRAVQAAGADVRLVVIGTITGIRTAAGITVTGAYAREQLPDLIERHRVDIALFPSVCPETFSYVAHEIRATGLPMVSFDLGAQGDLVRAYDAGHIARRMDGPGLLEEILAFARRLNAPRKEVIS